MLINSKVCHIQNQNIDLRIFDENMDLRVFDDIEGTRGRAVDTPVEVAVLIADADAEAAVVGTEQMHNVAGLATYPQLPPFARIGCAVLAFFWKNTQKYGLVGVTWVNV